MRWIAVLFLLSGCAIAPLTGGLTAPPLEKGKLQVDGSFTGYKKSDGDATLLVPSARVLYGLTEKLTIGGLTELKTLSAIGRWSFCDNLALAGMVTYFAHELSYTLGPIVSARFGDFEPYASFRYHLVNADRTDLDASFFTQPTNVRFTFFSTYGGLRYWITPLVAVGGEATYLLNPGTGEFRRQAFYTFTLTFGF